MLISECISRIAEIHCFYAPPPCAIHRHYLQVAQDSFFEINVHPDQCCTSILIAILNRLVEILLLDGMQPVFVHCQGIWSPWHLVSTNVKCLLEEKLCIANTSNCVIYWNTCDPHLGAQLETMTILAPFLQILILLLFSDKNLYFPKRSKIDVMLIITRLEIFMWPQNESSNLALWMAFSPID